MKGLGLDSKIIDQLNRDLALKRIQKDIQSDFIFAPHLNIVYHQAGEELYDQLLTKLKSGKYFPRLPININAIKSNGFDRLGSILEPFDRLAYQLIADYISTVAEKQIDRTQVFSHILLAEDMEGTMFEKSSESYSLFKKRIQALCEFGPYDYVLRADIASYFDRLYQHILGNLLYSSGADKEAISFLEKFLLQISQNDSHGIIQGAFPSDLLGNFCLCDIDAQHSLAGLEFSRYVDDMYIFFNSYNEARIHKVRLANWLRKDGLTLNESKTKIYKSEDLLQEETELDKLFNEATDEVLTGASIFGYETNFFWNLEADLEMEDEEVELEATKKLFDLNPNPDARQKIEKFCLPVFAVSESDYGLDYVIKNYTKDPSMSQIYFGYLSKMIRVNHVIVSDIESIFNDQNLIFDYQRMWLYASLLYASTVSDNLVRHALTDLQNHSKNVGLRSICAIIVGKYGNASFRRILKLHYSNENSEFVKSALLFSAQYFPTQEKDTCFKAWSGHNETNSLIVTAIKKK